MGGLDEKVSESLLWEVFVQGGPVGKFGLRFGTLFVVMFVMN